MAAFITEMAMTTGSEQLTQYTETDYVTEMGITPTYAPMEDDLPAYVKRIQSSDHIITALNCFIGLIANALTLSITLKSKMRRSPVGVFMSALAITDSLVLILDYVNNGIKKSWGIFIIDYSPGMCIFHRFAFEIAYTVSSWLVVGLSVQRCIVVMFPLRAKTICSRRNALIYIAIMPFVIMLSDCYEFWGWHLNPDELCDVHPRLSDFMNYVAPWITTVRYSLLPSFILVISNGLIIYRLAVARGVRRSMQAKDDPAALKSQRAEQRLTITVLVICISFMVFTLPLILFYAYIFGSGQFSLTEDPVVMFIEVFIDKVGMANYSCNFFLYVLASNSFRADLFNLAPCKALKRKYMKKTRYADSNQDVSNITKSSAVSEPSV